MSDYLDDVDTYEVIVTGDTADGEWLTIAEEVDWENLPEYLEGVQDHELNRMEAECLEAGGLSGGYYSELYGGDFL